MAQHRKTDMKKILTIAGAVILGLILIFHFWTKSPETPQPTPEMESNEPAHPIPEAEMKDGEGEGQPQVTIDYKDLNKDTPSDQLMVERKDKLGLNKSLDMVVKSNESFTLGDKTISMGKILEKAKTHKGGVYQENLNDSGKSSPKAIKEFGIYVVQPGDNIWNIHFNILKEYYSDRGIDVAPKADEPIKNGGMSSGVGKLLKFSEGMVIIYDLNDDEVAEGINLLQPLSKVVIYNMQEVFNLLSEIDYDTINRIQFDGTNIWIPTEKN